MSTDSLVHVAVSVSRQATITGQDEASVLAAAAQQATLARQAGYRLAEALLYVPPGGGWQMDLRFTLGSSPTAQQATVTADAPA